MSVLLALAVGRTLTSGQLMAQARSRMERARTITYTVVYIDNGSKTPRDLTRFWYRKDGYLRWEDASVFSIMTPSKTWLMRKGTLSFYVMGGGDTDWRMTSQLGLDIKVKSPQEPPTLLRWHDRSALQVEVEYQPPVRGHRTYVFFEAKTLLPLGTSERTSRGIYDLVCSDLKLNTKIDPALFIFAPPKGSREVKG